MLQRRQRGFGTDGIVSTRKLKRFSRVRDVEFAVSTNGVCSERTKLRKEALFCSGDSTLVHRVFYFAVHECLSMNLNISIRGGRWFVSR